MDLERYDVNGAYEQLGIARDPLIARVSGLARAGVTNFEKRVKLNYGVPEIVDETIVHLSLGGVPGTLPHDRPLQLGHLMETGALSARLRSTIEMWDPSCKDRDVKDLGASTYSELMRCPNAGIKTVVQLMTIVEASRQTDEFTKSKFALVNAQISKGTVNWESLSAEDQDRAVVRLVKMLGNPEFMDRVMPIVNQLEAQSNGLGLASPAAENSAKLIHQ